MTMFGSQWFANPGVTYEIDQSIRFDKTTSSHLSITFGSAGDRKTWTFSTWFKRGKIDGARQSLLAAAGQAYLQLGPDAASREMITLNSEGSGTDLNWYTTQVFRDPAAWYHLIWRNDTTQSDADNRVRLYVNGVQVTDFTKVATPDQDFEGAINNAVAHNIGELHIANYYYDGLQSEINFVDGLSLGPTSFGKVNNDGVWIPIEYTGAYGGNGFYLTGATSSDLGEDFSGNDNDFSSSGLAADDQIVDTPTDNYCTWNPIGQSSSITLSNGNLHAVGGGGKSARSTFEVPSSGKWYFEILAIVSGELQIGVHLTSGGFDDTGNIGDSNGEIGYRSDGGRRENGTTTGSWGATFVTDDVIGVAWDADANEIWFAKNNAWQASGDPAAGSNPANTTTISTESFFAMTTSSGTGGTANFGQLGFTYTPPTDFSALRTSNIADPTIADPSAYFQPTIYTGDGSTQSIDQGGNSTFEPDLVWIKNRDATDNHCLFDSVRGVTELLSSNNTDAESTDADTLTAFDSDGFSLGDDDKVNTNTEKYVGWQWLESTTSAFDIVSYTGTGSARTVSHNLGVKPDLMIIKRRDGTQNWGVYHSVITADYVMVLDLTNASLDDAAVFNDTEPTSSVFTVNTDGKVNANTQTYIAWLWAGVEGFSKFGSYTGNGDANGPFVWCGFTPAFVMTKRTSDASDWKMWDNQRGPYNVITTSLAANSNAAGNTGAAQYNDLFSNGFKIRGTDTETNGSGSTYIFAAFAETPFKTATAR
jgi:hypothetical protein